MLGTRMGRLLLAGLMLAGVTACGNDKTPPDTFAGAEVPSLEPSPSIFSPPPSPSKSPSVKPSSKKPTPKPSATLKKPVPAGGDTGGGKPASTADGVPVSGAGTFTAATGGTDVVGTGATLVKYRVEVEDGIQWGTNPVWGTAKTAAEVERAIGGPQGWTLSADHPVTYAPNKLTEASWSFQRVSGDDYSVRLRLATPNTVDKLCKAVGVNTQGIYSCRYGQTILLNLRRWLKGIDGYPGVDFHANTINHEMGHFLGFDHMKCPGSGLAPIMQTQTIALNGCKLNSFPFTAEGVFLQGPWAAS